MKKGETSSQVFVYILIAVVAVAALAIGFKAIGSIKSGFTKNQYEDFKIELAADVTDMSKQAGAITKKEFFVDPKYKTICFLSTDKVEDLPKDLVNTYPSVKAAPIETDNNVFLLNEKEFDAFKLDNLKYSSLCVPIDNGGFEVELWGKGDGTFVSEPTDSRSSLELEGSGAVSEDKEILSNDFHAKLQIPKGIAVTFPDTESTAIQVSRDPAAPEIPGQVFITSVYNFGPDGTTFSQEGALLTLDYDPTLVKNPENLMLYQFFDNEWHAVEQKTIDGANHIISAKIQHFSGTVAAGKCRDLPKTGCVSPCAWDTDKSECLPPVSSDDKCGGDTRMDFKTSDDNKILKEIDVSATKGYVWIVLKVIKEGSSTPLFFTGGFKPGDITQVNGRYHWVWDATKLGEAVAKGGAGAYTLEFWKDCVEDKCDSGTKCISKTTTLQ